MEEQKEEEGEGGEAQLVCVGVERVGSMTVVEEVVRVGREGEGGRWRGEDGDGGGGEDEGEGERVAVGFNASDFVLWNVNSQSQVRGEWIGA